MLRLVEHRSTNASYRRREKAADVYKRTAGHIGPSPVFWVDRRMGPNSGGSTRNEFRMRQREDFTQFSRVVGCSFRRRLPCAEWCRFKQSGVSSHCSLIGPESREPWSVLSS